MQRAKASLLSIKQSILNLIHKAIKEPLHSAFRTIIDKCNTKHNEAQYNGRMF
jgi:hypothetical protein